MSRGGGRQRAVSACALYMAYSQQFLLARRRSPSANLALHYGSPGQVGHWWWGIGSTKETTIQSIRLGRQAAMGRHIGLSNSYYREGRRFELRTLRVLSRRLSRCLGLACVLGVALVGCVGQAPAETVAPTATTVVTPAPTATNPAKAPITIEPTKTSAPRATTVVIPAPTVTSPAEDPTSLPSSYKFLRKWGGDDGQLRSPEVVAVDAAGNVYVADTGNHRIQVFGLGP